LYIAGKSYKNKKTGRIRKVTGTMVARVVIFGKVLATES
jgi:hypothetical protein